MLFRTTHTKINSVWFVPHLPNFNHHVCQTMNILYLNFHMCGSSNWASEASPTLGCSIEISRDIYICMYVCMYVGMSSIVYGKTIQKNRMLK